ncbi:hypothetical protein AIOL_001228 [Candidatus Rhodobacter oscarellae]|uniref:Uncharacterized protein n=1 Tax=Candidatus Rhodobacter oscarellae TaxID=1675527 RepID=A0A0J9E016_9RHOB|nr:hypothetical protein [Candidatus Rhodobacter lobularis]KMW56276.1 hypothetical protein AIOL_001228 [Candidatus Rhodobacter lobularis]
MRILFSAALMGAVSFAAPALAWNETQPATDNMLVYAYKTKHNYCPTGLQPVVVGGVICCGTPNGHYESHSASSHHRAHSSHASPGTVVVYEKGQ